jgi:hypothetical protein
MVADEEWRGWSDREIARRCAVSHLMVANMKRELSGNYCQIAPVERVVERNGTAYIMHLPGVHANGAHVWV